MNINVLASNNQLTEILLYNMEWNRIYSNILIV